MHLTPQPGAPPLLNLLIKRNWKFIKKYINFINILIIISQIFRVFDENIREKTALKNVIYARVPTPLIGKRGYNPPLYYYYYLFILFAAF